MPLNWLLSSLLLFIATDQIFAAADLEEPDYKGINELKLIQSTLVNVRTGCNEVFFDNRLLLERNISKWVLLHEENNNNKSILANLALLLMGPGRIWTTAGFSDDDGCGPDLSGGGGDISHWATIAYVCNIELWQRFKDVMAAIWENQSNLALKLAVDREGQNARNCFLMHHKHRHLQYHSGHLKDMAMLLSEMECRKEAIQNNLIGSYCEE